MEVDEANAAPTPSASHAPSAAEASTTSSSMASSSSPGGSASSSVVLAPSGTTGSVSIALHPLVIMNISEHWTRTKAQAGGPQTIYGALIGQQRGREIELMNSFELAHHRLDDRDVIDREYYALKESQFKQVFSEMDFLGWYSTGEAPGPAEVDIQRQICEINESPLFLQLHPAARHTDLPVAIYESVVDLVGGQARLLFVPLTYSLQTEEAERIGLDHVARISGAVDDGHSQVDEHVMVQHSAIKMLASRVQVILRYVREVHAGTLPFNHDVMREAKALADRLPVLESARFQPEFYTQCNDAALLTYLGTIMKSCNHLNQFIKKFNVLYQRQGGHGRRLRGIFF